MREVKPQERHTCFSGVLVFGRVWRKGGAHNVGTRMCPVAVRTEASVELSTCVRTIRFVRRAP